MTHCAMTHDSYDDSYEMVYIGESEARGKRRDSGPPPLSPNADHVTDNVSHPRARRAACAALYSPPIGRGATRCDTEVCTHVYSTERPTPTHDHIPRDRSTLEIGQQTHCCAATPARAVGSMFATRSPEQIRKQEQLTSTKLTRVDYIPHAPSSPASPACSSSTLPFAGDHRAACGSMVGSGPCRRGGSGMRGEGCGMARHTAW